MSLRKNRNSVSNIRLQKGREKVLLSLLKNKDINKEEKVKIQIKIAINNPGYYQI